jgi:membrane protease YdiL (CAAX protease family)
MTERKLGAAIALPAYVVLIVGMVIIGGQLQARDVVSGLWVSEAIAIALPAIFVLCVARVRIAPFLGLRGLTWKQALAAAVLSAANQPVVSFLTWATRKAMPQTLVDQFDDQQRLLNTLFVGHAAWLMVGTVVVAAALGEEIFFRGYLLPSLRKSWGLVAALLVSSALFSLVHMEWVGFFGLMEIGLLFAALRIWTGSLWASVIAHAVNNGIAGVAFLYGYQDPDIPTPAWLLVLGAVLFVAGLLMLPKIVRKDLDYEEERVPPKASTSVALAVVWSVAFAAGIVAMRGR